MVPLSAVEAGQTVRLRCVNACGGLEARLAAMGLLPGVELEVIRSAPNGPFIIEVKSTRLVLGRGMAQKIEVD